MAKEYKIITSEEYEQLENMVTAYLNEGWDLVGGLVVAKTDIHSAKANELGTTYLQAIRKDS